MSSSAQWSLGSGEISFPLVNLRNTVAFQYVSVDEKYNWSVLATSNTVTFADMDEPTQAHIALTSKPTEMRIMWVSSTNKTPNVYYGATTNLGQVAYGTSRTYSASDLCAAPANSTDNGAFRDPGYQHDVLLTGLQLNTKYYYTIGNIGRRSDVLSFVSSPGVGAHLSLDFIMFGDMGVNTPFEHPYFWQKHGVEQQSMAPKSLKWIKRYVSQNLHNPKLVMDIGDISYARGYSILWDYYMESIAPIAATTPWMVSIGNHEFDWTGQAWRPEWSDYGMDSLGECGIPYSTRFNMPGPTYGPLRNLWYSFDMGPVHFVVMSTEQNFLAGSEQWNWIQKDLKSVDRSVTPWVIFHGHRPFYTSSSTTINDGTTAHLRSDVEPLLYKYNVDMVLTGHMHKYERMCGFTDSFNCGARDEDGVVHIIVGTAGNTFQVGWDDNEYASHKSQPDWSVFRTDEWGISELKVNATTLEFVYYGDQRGEVHDRLVLHKPERVKHINLLN